MAWVILYYTLGLFKWLIIARAIMSWFVSPYSPNPAAVTLRKLTDPIIRPISEIMPMTGGIDLSPIVAFFIIHILQRLIIGIA